MGYVYSPEDPECTGHLWDTVDFGADKWVYNGVRIGRRHYLGITDYRFQCTAGLNDPLTSHFRAQYAVKV